jgi:hypothetical protein
MKIPIKERKKYVINLHKKGYTIRQISEELHMSTRDVDNIVIEYKKEQKEARERAIIEKEEKTKEQLFSSKRSEAFKLYKEGTKPLDVAIKLEISAEEANTFYQNYCSLQYPPQYLQIYTELNNTHSFNRFIDLFHLVRQKKLSVEKTIEAIESIDDIPLLEERHQDLSEKVANLQHLQDNFRIDNNFLKDKNEELEKRLNYFCEKNEIAEKKLEDLDKRIIDKQQKISKINSGEDYYKAREKAKLIVEEFVKEHINLIRLCISSISQVVNENQQEENSGLNIPDSVYEYVLKSSDNDVNQKKIDRVSEKMLDNISEICTDDLVNSSLDI